MELLEAYQNAIKDLTLVTSDNGVFDVVVDGTTIYSKHEIGRHVEPGEILRLFTDYVGKEARRGEE
ncbi:MAG: hypothetical protein CL467_02610 [Acidimicrobiaceae bacterium]|nr:hypothetical protein [Acidimicrobiaceae bacterium]